MNYNPIYGSYVTSASFCMKLGKGEIAALAAISEHGNVRDSTSPALWSLSAKGLTATENHLVKLTAAGECAVKMLIIAGLITEPVATLQAAE